MKTQKIFAFTLALILSQSLVCQTFRYQTWELNKTVTFNDIINNLEDKSKIITEPSVYVNGSDIKFHDVFDTKTTFSFFKNTQILHCIFVNDIKNIFWVNQLRKSIMDQLGKPTYGYEIEKSIDCKDKTFSADYLVYDMNYKYVIPGYWIIISIQSNALGSTNGSRAVTPIYTFSACIHERLESDIEAGYRFYPTLVDNDCGWAIIKSKLINKW